MAVRVVTIVSNDQDTEWREVHQASFPEHGLNYSAWRRAIIQRHCDQWRKQQEKA